MTLAEYLTVTGLSVRAFAKLAGLDDKAVYRYREGTRRPSAEAQQRITRASWGAVTADDTLRAWLDHRRRRGKGADGVRAA